MNNKTLLVKKRYCVAGLPLVTDSYAWASEIQEYEVLQEIQKMLDDDWIKQAVFNTSQGEYCPLYVSYSREYNKEFYRILEINGHPLKERWEK